MITPNTLTSWVEALAEVARDEEGAAVVLIDEAVARLYGSLRRAFVRLSAGQATDEDRQGIEAAKGELEHATRGQSFRVETVEGPMFVWAPLHRFAGQVGPHEGDDPAADPVWTRTAA